MSRTEELTDRFLDGSLTEAEWAELESLLASDAVAEVEHLALLELEAVLRGERIGLDLAAPTMAVVRETQAEKLTQSVMAEIATSPAPHWATRTTPALPPSRRGLVAVAGLCAVAAALLIGFWLGTGTPEPARPGEPSPSAPAFAKLTRSLGSVRLIPPQGEPFAAEEGHEVPPGHTLCTVGEDSSAQIELPDLTTVDIEPDSVVRFVAVAKDAKTTQRLFLAAGQLTAAVPIGSADRSLVVGTGVADVFARNGTFIVSSAGPESTRVDIKRGNVEVVRTDSSANSTVRMTDGGAFFQAGFAKVVTEPTLRIDRVPARTLPFPGARSATFSPNGSELWIASARQFTRWTRDGGTADTLFLPRKGDGIAVAFTRDKTTLVTFSGATKDDKVIVRTLPDAEERATFGFRLPDTRFWTLAPDAAWFAAAEPKPNHKKVRVIDGTTGEDRFTQEFEDVVGCVASSPDGKSLAVGISDSGRGANNKVAFIDPANGTRLMTLPTQKKGLMALAFSADGHYLAAGYAGLVQVWDLRTRELIKPITGFERVVTCLSFTPDGRGIAAGTADGLIWVWSASNGKVAQLIEVGSKGVRTIAYSPDGKRLAIVANNAPVMQWDAAEIPTDIAEVQ